MKAAAPQVPGDDELRVKQLIANGRKQLASGNYVSAANNFEAALDIDPDNAAAKAGLAEIEQNRR
jgi:Tfp pilus assembly protein PilF